MNEWRLREVNNLPKAPQPVGGGAGMESKCVPEAFLPLSCPLTAFSLSGLSWVLTRISRQLENTDLSGLFIWFCEESRRKGMERAGM